MSKQAINRVSTIKLHGGQYMQTGRETLKEPLRVNFPGQKITDDSGGDQGQQNLGICRGTMNREKLELDQSINQ
jgi:hypothetical protein